MGCGTTGLIRACAIAVAAAITAPVAAQENIFKEPDITTLAAEGNVDAMKRLLLSDRRVNKKDSKGHSALVIASIGGEVEIVELLLDAGARTDIADKLGNTPLSLASSQGEEDIVRLLLEAGADIDSRNRQGITPLIQAASKSRFQIVRILLDAGADVNLLDYTGRGALGWARDGRDPRIEQALQRAGARD